MMNMAKKVVTIVILLLMATLITGTVVILSYDEREVAKNKIEEKARDYYENSLYSSLIKEGMEQEEIEGLMERYLVRGFARVRLRQLLLREENGRTEDANLIRKYCDEDKTTVKFYPEAPFDKKSYRVEYEYECEFGE